MNIRSWRSLIVVWLVAVLYVLGGMNGAVGLHELLARKRAANNSVQLLAANQTTPTPAPQLTPTEIATPASVHGQASQPAAVARANPFVGAKLFVDPDNPAQVTVAEWSSTRAADAAVMRRIAQTPVTVWLGDWQSNIGAATTQELSNMRAQGALPVFVLYNIPVRDCGSYSAGGASSAAAYQSWIQAIQNASQGSKAVFLLEPDALAGWECLSGAQKAERVNILRTAITTLTSSPNHYVYLDAGNARWHTAAEIASRLKEVGVEHLHGIALNISNFLTTTESRQYGQQISQLTGGLHVVVDSSRNGAGPAPNLEWCNPTGRKIGEVPRAVTGQGALDAVLWVKYPGESDGACNGGPSAGEWWPEYALSLVN